MTFKELKLGIYNVITSKRVSVRSHSLIGKQLDKMVEYLRLGDVSNEEYIAAVKSDMIDRDANVLSEANTYTDDQIAAIPDPDITPDIYQRLQVWNKSDYQIGRLDTIPGATLTYTLLSDNLPADITVSITRGKDGNGDNVTGVFDIAVRADEFGTTISQDLILVEFSIEGRYHIYHVNTFSGSNNGVPHVTYKFEIVDESGTLVNPVDGQNFNVRTTLKID